MPFSELGELTGVPNQIQPAPSPLPSVPQLKAKSAFGAHAAQRVAGLARQALDLVQNALAAGRRGRSPSCHATLSLTHAYDSMICFICSFIQHTRVFLQGYAVFIMLLLRLLQCHVDAVFGMLFL